MGPIFVLSGICFPIFKVQLASVVVYSVTTFGCIQVYDATKNHQKSRTCLKERVKKSLYSMKGFFNLFCTAESQKTKTNRWSP
jgi:hypothetical protein